MEEKKYDLHHALKMMIEKYLGEYCEKWNNFYVMQDGNSIAAHGKRNQDDYILIRTGINYENEEVHVYNFCIPKDDRGSGIGLRLLHILYQVCKRFQFVFCLVDVTEPFKRRMLERGAIETLFPDTLQIIDATDLNSYNA